MLFKIHYLVKFSVAFFIGLAHLEVCRIWERGCRIWERGSWIWSLQQFFTFSLHQDVLWPSHSSHKFQGITLGSNTVILYENAYENAHQMPDFLKAQTCLYPECTSMNVYMHTYMFCSALEKLYIYTYVEIWIIPHALY